MKLYALALAAIVAVAVPAVALSSMHPDLTAKLAPKNENPKGPAGASGFVNLHLKADAKKVCWEFHITGLKGANAAHIHKGKAGVSGPVIVPLGATYKAKGCIAAPKATIQKIEANPNAYYVNVHTAKFPAGAIRGQLVVGMTTM